MMFHIPRIMPSGAIDHLPVVDTNNKLVQGGTWFTLMTLLETGYIT